MNRSEIIGENGLLNQKVSAKDLYFTLFAWKDSLTIVSENKVKVRPAGGEETEVIFSGLEQ